MKEWLTDRYDSRSVPDAITYRRTGKKNDTPAIEFSQAPRINILATSSYDWFINSLDQADATGGFIPRWLVVHIPATGRLLPKPLAANRELIPALGERLLEIRKLQGNADLSLVEAIYDEYYRPAHKRFSSQSNPALAMPFFNRLRGEVLKLAVIFEVSQSGSLKVSEQAMRRAIEAARAIEQTIFEILPTGMNKEGFQVERMAERIRSAGKAGLPKSELTLAFKHWKPQERRERLQTLVEAGTVHCARKPTPGRTAEVYVHNDHLRPA